MNRLLPRTLVLLACGLVASLRAQGVAMVADLQGRATLLSEPLALTSEIPATRMVSVDAGSRLVLIALQDGEEITVHGPARFHLDAQGHPLAADKHITRKGAVVPHLQAALKPGGLAQASVVMREADPNALVPLAPEAGVLEARPHFAWSAPVGHRFTFALKEATGKELLSQEEAGAYAELPPGLELAPGVAYTWTVEDLDAPAWPLRFEAQVTRLGEPLRQTLDALRAHRESSFAQGLVYAAALTEAGLRKEAHSEWRRLATLRPGDPVLEAFAE
jgi:hypothetical protein